MTNGTTETAAAVISLAAVVHVGVFSIISTLV